MKAFATLYARLDQTTKTNEKVEALTSYFRSVAPADAAWAIYFLVGRKLRQVVASRSLRDWARAAASIPDWMFQECYDAVGDIAETIALLLPDAERSSTEPLRVWVEDRLLAIRDADEGDQRRLLLESWGELDATQRLVWNKLITGAFRVGVSQQLVIRALGQASGVDPAVIAHRLMGDWEPSEAFYARLIDPDRSDALATQPYPFCLAHALESAPGALGDREAWQVEWKWDGIRAQMLKRRGEVAIWTRGEELVTERYPELVGLAGSLPDGSVLDGEILAWRDGRPLPFAQMQRRIGRKTVGPKLLREVPVVLVGYDILEWDGQDIRSRPLRERRAILDALAASIGPSQPLLISPRLRHGDWSETIEARAESRRVGAEGLMIKRLESPYQVGRVRGDWWKWKVDPLTVDAVLVAAQRGSGKRASLYTDYSFAIWDGDELVTFAKAYSGLTDAEIRDLDAWIRQHMRERFGPVRTVEPLLVFELGFENIQRSTRHKSGLAVRFPRILRQRTDKTAEQADTLEILLRLVDETEATRPVAPASHDRNAPAPPVQGLLFD